MIAFITEKSAAASVLLRMNRKYFVLKKPTAEILWIILLKKRHYYDESIWKGQNLKRQTKCQPFKVRFCIQNWNLSLQIKDFWKSLLFSKSQMGQRALQRSWFEHRRWTCTVQSSIVCFDWSSASSSKGNGQRCGDKGRVLGKCCQQDQKWRHFASHGFER